MANIKKTNPNPNPNPNLLTEFSQRARESEQNRKTAEDLERWKTEEKCPINESLTNLVILKKMARDYPAPLELRDCLMRWNSYSTEDGGTNVLLKEIKKALRQSAGVTFDSIPKEYFCIECFSVESHDRPRRNIYSAFAETMGTEELNKLNMKFKGLVQLNFMLPYINATESIRVKRWDGLFKFLAGKEKIDEEILNNFVKEYQEMPFLKGFKNKREKFLKLKKEEKIEII